KGKVVIFKNSIKSLEEIMEVLLEKGIKDEEIQILHSQEKESETYSSIVKSEKIPEGVKYILTTSVISDGVNIGNGNIDAVYMIESENLIQLRQFVARFRKGVRNVVDIIPKAPDEVRRVKWFDYPVELRRLISLYENIADTKTAVLRESGLIPNSGKADFIKRMFGNLSHEMNFLRMNYEMKEVEVNYQLLAYDVLSDFHRVAYLNPEKRKEYLEHTLNIQISVKEVDSATVDTTSAKERVRARMEENRSRLIELLDSSPKEAITCYLKNVNPNMIRNAEKTLEDLYLKDKPMEDFFEQHKSILRLKESERLIGKYILFTKYKFPHELIIELLKKSPNELYEFELGYLTQLVLYMVKNHQKMLRYNKKSLKVFHYAVFKFIYDFFEDNKKFTFDGLLKELNKYLLENKITEEPVGKGGLGLILKQMIKKVKWTKKEGKQTKTLGWKFIGYRGIGDLVGKDPALERIIRQSMKSYLESEVAFTKFNLFAASLEGDSSDNSEQRRLLDEMKRDLGRLS
ncbi:MAG: hypothetical protein ACM3RX_03175, partial [Methanococcaceae archaeon]